MYIEASGMNGGVAMVREYEDRIYYINASGIRLTPDYPDGSEFDESGKYATVKMNNDKWGIINSEGNVVFWGADRIEEIQSPYHIGSAVVDGHAVLLELQENSNAECEIIQEFDGYKEISCVYGGKYAIITDETGKKGVVDYNGKVFIPAEYENIECETLDGKDAPCEIFCFKLLSSNGTYSFKKYMFGSDN